MPNSLSDLGGAAMAARHGALSADHLEWLGQDGIDAMAASGTVAVLLPGAFYTLRETQLPPVQALRDAGVPMALATDLQPRHLAADLAPADDEHGRDAVPHDPGRMPDRRDPPCGPALGLTDRGRSPPACAPIWRSGTSDHPAELTYRIGFNPLHARIVGGEFV
jgi:imidazolonepropionase